MNPGVATRTRKTRQPQRSDAIVIGAGVAGLIAARDLSAAGLSVRILEARTRIGGRVCTIHPADGYPIELGAEFIQGDAPQTWSLVEKEGLTAYDVTDAHHQKRGNKLIEHPEGRSFGRLCRVLGGHDRIVHALWRSQSKNVALELGCRVHRIQWSRGYVEVSTEQGLFAADRVVIALPLGALKSGGIEILPRIREKEESLSQLHMGSVVRVHLRFHPEFHRQLLGKCFLYSNDLHFPIWWTSLPMRSPIISGWAGGESAKRVAFLSPDQLLAVALESLASTLSLPPVELKPEAWYSQDWQMDPLTRGAHSYVETEGFGASAKLARPVSGTLYFAGEATAPAEWMGTVEGALQSGVRAAAEILSEVSMQKAA